MAANVCWMCLMFWCISESMLNGLHYVVQWLLQHEVWFNFTDEEIEDWDTQYSIVIQDPRLARGAVTHLWSVSHPSLSDHSRNRVLHRQGPSSAEDCATWNCRLQPGNMASSQLWTPCTNKDLYDYGYLLIYQTGMSWMFCLFCCCFVWFWL